MTSSGFRVRPATADDDDAIREISLAYDNLASWPSRPDFIDHEMATGRVYVAEGDDGVAGFGGSFDRGDVVYLADLFVRPDAVGRGIGRAVLELIFDRDCVRMTSASDDPRALPLYARFGMVPLMPALYLRGTAGTSAAAAAAAEAAAGGGLDVRAGSAEEITAIDAEVSGRPRPQEHEFMASSPGAEGLLLLERGQPVAYGWMRVVTIAPGASGAADATPETRAYISPAGARTPEAMARMTGGLLRRASERVDAEAAAAGAGVADVSLLVLGPHPGLSGMLAAGFRVVDRDTFMCSRLDLIDGRRYAHSPELG
jgi:GNAT superfamily N-acetyltransferase